MKRTNPESPGIIKPAFAGRFYPADGRRLSLQLESLFAKAKKPASGLPPQAIIAPHAGYVFSGQVAASAYNQLPVHNEYKRVFLLAASHYSSFKGAVLPKASFYETPLGKIKVDEQLVDELSGYSKWFSCQTEVHRHEHSTEVQLPFLQHKFRNEFKLVPIIIGNVNFSDCKQMAAFLDPWFSPENLFIVSTDFSHYPAYDDATDNDYATAEAICSNDPEALRLCLAQDRKISNLDTSLCGSAAVFTLLFLTQHRKMKFVQTEYRNSGDEPLYGQKDKVVGYWAMAVYDNMYDIDIPPRQQAEMLEDARKAIQRFVETGIPAHRGVRQYTGFHPAGMFVSIYIGGKLHGCIGSIEKGSTWNETVEHLAVSASCDKRFNRLTKDDLKDMDLEISILSPLKPIRSIEEIELGRHGIYIKKGANTGTYLPKVAALTGWSVEELLGHCACDKAGLGWNDWKEAEVFVYEAFVFRG